MDPDVIKKVLDELYLHLEPLETQTTALLQFLTAKGVVKEDEFAPLLEEAGKASYVKWLTTRLRIEHVLSSAKEAVKPAEIEFQPPPKEPEEKKSKELSEEAAQEPTLKNQNEQSGQEESKKTAPHKQKGAA